MTISDSVERVVAEALTGAGIAYIHGGDGRQNQALDFYLPALDIHIECKQFHSPRIVEQMQRYENVIVIQGLAAACAFARLVRGGTCPPATT